MHDMNQRLARLSAIAIVVMATGITVADEADREMNVQSGPETVFAVPVDAIFPELAAAEATNLNGRVGNELVFWGYRLADGRDVELVACATLRNVDCAEREARVCPGSIETLAQTTVAGLVRQRICRSVALAAPGDTRPGCHDRDSSEELAVSLIQCR